MKITFDLPYVFVPGASEADNAFALQKLLECLIHLNMGFLRAHSVPSLYRSGVVYGRTDDWCTIPSLYRLGYGDCKSLTAALIAEYRMQGIMCNPVFRFIPNREGACDYHILVQTSAGFEDPSKRLGMGQNENSWFRR